MVELFLKGGPLMYPLLIFSIVSIAIIIERGVYLGKASFPKTKLDTLLTVVNRDSGETALREYDGLKGPVPEIGRIILRNRDLSREELENQVSHAGSRELKLLTRNLHLLELIGKISPMVGLSGTVLGLAGTFQTVASLKTAADPSLLAGGIWEALITTVTGLFIAIPAIIFYHLYENKVKSISFAMKDHAESIISALKENR